MTVHSEFSVGLAHKLCTAAGRQGWTPKSLNELAEDPELLRQILLVKLGHAKAVPNELVIDLNTDPFTPPGWTVHNHRMDGVLTWHPNHVDLCVVEGQEGTGISGYDLWQELDSARLLNANVLNFLLSKPSFIPWKWRSELVVFWGTVYAFDGKHYVLYLVRRSGRRWTWQERCLDETFGRNFSSAVLVS